MYTHLLSLPVIVAYGVSSMLCFFLSLSFFRRNSVAMMFIGTPPLFHTLAFALCPVVNTFAGLFLLAEFAEHQRRVIRDRKQGNGEPVTVVDYNEETGILEVSQKPANFVKDNPDFPKN
jgi:hypothetical protein